MLPRIPFCSKIKPTEVYVLHFGEVKNKCLPNSLTVSTILLLKAVFIECSSNVFKELKSLPIPKVALL